MRKKDYSQEVFDELVYSFGEDDPVFENDEETMREALREYLAIGCDASFALEILSAEEKWSFYDILTYYGVSLDPTELMRELPVELVEDQWDTFVKRGVLVKDLARHCSVILADNYDDS